MFVVQINLTRFNVPMIITETKEEALKWVCKHIIEWFCEPLNRNHNIILTLIEDNKLQEAITCFEKWVYNSELLPTPFAITECNMDEVVIPNHRELRALIVSRFGQ